MTDQSLEGPRSEGSSGSTPSESWSDADLVRALSAGDTDALAELWRRHHRGVRSVGSKQLRDPSLVDDLVQDTFLRLLTAAPGLREPEKVGHWLLTVAKHACIDRSRGARVRREVPVAAVEVHGLVDAAPSPEDQTVSKAMASAALGALSDAQAALLEDHYLRDVDLASMAVRGGSTPGSVKVRLHRARLRARRALHEGGWKIFVPISSMRWAYRGDRHMGSVHHVAGAALASVLVGMALIVPAPFRAPVGAGQEGSPLQFEAASSMAHVEVRHHPRTSASEVSTSPRPAPASDQSSHSERRAVLPLERVGIPVVGRDVRSSPEPGSQPDYVIVVEGTPESLQPRFEAYNEPETAAINKTSCDVVDLLPTAIRCDRRGR